MSQQNIFEDTLHILGQKLSIATTRAKGERKTKEHTWAKLKYALWAKRSIDSAIADLESWQRVFCPTWYTVIVLPSVSNIDTILKDQERTNVVAQRTKRLRDLGLGRTDKGASVFLPSDKLDSARRVTITYTSIETVLAMLSQGPPTPLILDTVTCERNADQEQVKKDVRDLAQKLKNCDPGSFGLLQCSGVVSTPKPAAPASKSYAFVYKYPPALGNPKSLRDLLIKGDQNGSLRNRIKIAKQIASALSYVHAFGFVHKNLRPETVLVFGSAGVEIESAFLVGFERFRLAEGKTLRSSDADRRKNLYRHPQRQDINPEKDYTMQHDIYSLGVCLLEIGLWETFVEYDIQGHNASACDASISISRIVLDGVKDTSKMKDTLVDLAKTRLPCKVGDKYTGVVVNCLTCLDETNIDFGNPEDFQDADGVVVGVQYIEKVSLQIHLVQRKI
ncbi:uncharacterized protein A1O9_07085 [Exophiala aquamarina CBS 119918]|uniref:Protein kinase domain-containing protein n=1 Tax=Exophiala aquamarina CBS 119918 TaxID=1182545 RepID=A0A072PMZ6_9EURO|nr:uncharacterized protein A1O9_07085 [Exophiala aquamarina CBS 119918]KEF56895.1 hypothetical protein A1O9_07085 [Exophiala aquamarina CBS 119918]